MNDDFQGAAPDLGALECECPLPIYGIRPEGVDETNEPGTSCAGGGGMGGGGSGGGSATGGNGTGAASQGGEGQGAHAGTGGAGADAINPLAPDDEGCGCRVGGSSSSARSAWLAAIGVALGRQRRKRLV